MERMRRVRALARLLASVEGVVLAPCGDPVPQQRACGWLCAPLEVQGRRRSTGGGHGVADPCTSTPLLQHGTLDCFSYRSAKTSGEAHGDAWTQACEQAPCVAVH
jgi:hypothetical protein